MLCCGSVSFWYGSSVCVHCIRTNLIFTFTFFFYQKYIFPKNYLFCYLWANYLCALKKSAISFFSNKIFLWYWSSLVWNFLDFAVFLATRIRTRETEMKRIRIRNAGYFSPHLCSYCRCSWPRAWTRPRTTSRSSQQFSHTPTTDSFSSFRCPVPQSLIKLKTRS